MKHFNEIMDFMMVIAMILAVVSYILALNGVKIYGLFAFLCAGILIMVFSFATVDWEDPEEEE